LNWFAGSAWWAALLRWRRSAVAHSDPAEMGTAFGLDATLIPSESFAGDTPIARDGNERAWERRLVRRREV